MYDLVTLVIAASISALAGLVVGWLIASQRDDHHDDSEKENFEAQINELKQQNQEYQEEVTTHFAKTASLLNELTNNYRDVHNHLAEGAQKLASTDEDTLLKIAGGNAEEAEKMAEQLTAPLDYAPKKVSTESILSEKYGLDNIS